MFHLNQEVIYHEGNLDLPTDITDKRNRTDLQVFLRWTITEVSPTRISLAHAQLDPKATAITIKGNMKIVWSATTQPLTLCTSGTLLEVGSAAATVRMAAHGHERARYLLSRPPCHRWSCGKKSRMPEPDDLKLVYPFKTIPSGDEGVEFSNAVSWETILRPSNQPVPEDQMPIPGDKYKLAFAPRHSNRNGHYKLISWWNWGDLDGDLRDKKLRNMNDPRLSGSKVPIPDDVVQTYRWWGKHRDDEGNLWIDLLIHMDTTPHIVEFTD